MSFSKSLSNIFRSAESGECFSVLTGETIKRYTNPLVAYIQAVLLASETHKSQFTFELHPNATHLPAKLIRQMARGTTSEKTLLNTLHDLVFHLLCYVPGLGNNMWDMPVDRFIAICALRPGGNFKDAQLTPLFAELKYATRIAMSVEAMNRVTQPQHQNNLIRFVSMSYILELPPDL
jgi:hypothetical protein